jgi:DNA helicase II / ATP-dependent DNA helicase PcrA
LVRTNAQVPVVRAALDRVHLSVRARRGRGPLDVAVAEAAEQGGIHRLLAWATAVLESVPERDDDTSRARRQVATFVEEFVADTGGGDGRSFAGWVRSSGVLSDAGGDDDGVDVMTFHAAKGREWPVVAVAGFEQRLVPHSTARTPDARAEETRLAYVAVTRAADRLLVTWTRQRRDRASGPSPLIEVMRVVPDAVVSAPPQLRRRPTTSDDTVPRLEALRRWRATVARAAAIDPAVVCTDAELRRLAKQAPQHVDQVAEVVGPLFARRHGEAIVRAIAHANGDAPRGDQSARSTITGA